jgi:hypothetical protein
MNTVYEAGLSRDTLSRVMENSPSHLRPIIAAVRDGQIAFMFVAQGFDAFRIPKRADRPSITILGDDLNAAHGPDGFHLPSVRRVIRASAFFAVVSSAPPTGVYATMAATTVASRKNGLIIETRPEQEIPWLALIQKMAPGRPIYLATVKGGTA